RHVLAPVRFAEGIAALATTGVSAYVEVGPKPALLALAQACLPDIDAAWLPSLREGNDGLATVESLAEVYVQGSEVDWKAYHEPHRRRRVAVPTYPFERGRYWIERPRRGGPLASQAIEGSTPLAGAPVSLLSHRAIYHVTRVGTSLQP